MPAMISDADPNQVYGEPGAPQSYPVGGGAPAPYPQPSAGAPGVGSYPMTSAPETHKPKKGKHSDKSDSSDE